MNVPTHRDGKGQLYVEWAQAGGRGYKRAWIRHATGDKDWAGTGRYLNVVRVTEPGAGPAGNSTDFPILSDLPEAQILVSFVTAVASIAGDELEFV